MSENLEVLWRLGAALAIGLLIGFERGWEVRDRAEGTRIAGVRTFAVVGLLGGAVGVLALGQGGWVVAGALAALGALLAVAHARDPGRDKDQSITTLVALLACFTLAVLAGVGEVTVAAAASVVVALLLGVKPELHGLLQRIRREELLATIRLLLISVVILPVLPDRGFGPYAAFNPYRLWWMVVLVAAISYVGYVAARITGERRGVLAMALFGGLASSTAVALSLARLGRDKAVAPTTMTAGTVIASAVMFPRALVIVAVLAPELAPQVAAALLPAAAVALAGAWIWLRRKPDGSATAVGAEGLTTGNPLDLPAAIKFGALLAAIMVLARAAADVLGDAGLIAVAAVSGLADVDAIILSVVQGFSDTAFGPLPAVAAILTAVAVNTAFKVALVAAIAGARAGISVGLPLVAALAAGAAGVALAML
jgi:uncharacterized membrane protein (DUF4010 family)